MSISNDINQADRPIRTLHHVPEVIQDTSRLFCSIGCHENFTRLRGSSHHPQGNIGQEADQLKGDTTPQKIFKGAHPDPARNHRVVIALGLFEHIPCRSELPLLDLDVHRIFGGASIQK